MKIQKGNMLIENMKLEKGEIFQVGTGLGACKMQYGGTTIVRDGKIYKTWCCQLKKKNNGF